ncbi:hydroxyisourate hydrolase [Nocardioides sp. YIM 152315]|uniref:hydroxyisourate hydrolase n=1 Tax=Nocardioides sp. YIM 152315 TaxID=3031760 RepID=UPI0023DC9B7D|nr:hydroxyisourate hydrolase [Nocardioides sp. YIM 152315]MDF1603479.1 hydroxyisourate hydrolase [Nocardioides sp. YIM 152315]
MSTLSTHVLDTNAGVPVVGLRVHLGNAADEALETGSTDDDGRVRFAADLPGGVYVLTFETGPWYGGQGRETFFPVVGIAVEIDPGRPHHHVPLLLSPFAYTTYRGS